MYYDKLNTRHQRNGSTSPPHFCKQLLHIVSVLLQIIVKKLIHQASKTKIPGGCTAICSVGAFLFIFYVVFLSSSNPMNPNGVVISQDTIDLSHVNSPSLILSAMNSNAGGGGVGGSWRSGGEVKIKNINVDEDSVDDVDVADKVVTEFINGIFFYNIAEPIERDLWPFECLRTRMRGSVNTHLCIHDPKYDSQLSAQIKKNGLWEPTNVRSFLRQLALSKQANVIDIGANVGLYSLLGAKMGRQVIAVEPLHENLNRLHMASHLESVQSKIVVLANAVSNKRNELTISVQDFNIGGSYVKETEQVSAQRMRERKNSFASSSVLVNSILLDDLVDVYDFKINNINNNTNKNNSKSKNNENDSKNSGGSRDNNNQFVLKIDIEGYEPYAFERASRMFDKLTIVAIFMEFGKTLEMLNEEEEEEKKEKENRHQQQQKEKDGKNESGNSSYLSRVQSMLAMLRRRNYEPYEANGINKLAYSKWKEWPWDIYLRQCDMIDCPGHAYPVVGF